MIKRLVTRRAHALVDMGRPILAQLGGDPRLTKAADSMKITQSELEAKVDAFDAARTAVRDTRIARDQAQRLLSAEVREFAFILLSGNGNHHSTDLYLKYFPNGCDDAMQPLRGELGTFAALILTRFAQETDPKILVYRDRVEGARNGLLAAEDAFYKARRTREEAFALMQTEKRNWARGLARAEALAKSACHFEPAYLRSIFAAVRTPRSVLRAESEIEETAAIAASMPPVLAAPAPVPAPPRETAA